MTRGRQLVRAAVGKARVLRVTFAALVAAAVLAAVGGCGQSGPLFLPDEAGGGADAGAAGGSNASNASGTSSASGASGATSAGAAAGNAPRSDGGRDEDEERDER